MPSAPDPIKNIFFHIAHLGLEYKELEPISKSQKMLKAAKFAAKN